MKVVLALFGILLVVGVGLMGRAEGAGIDRAAWREACHLAGYSCNGIARPQVAEAPMGALLGRYRMGDSYILVNDRLSGPLAFAVRVHEMTHYLQYKRKAWTFTAENRCLMEKEAFDVSNRVVRRLHDYKNVVDWEEMKVVYGCEI